MLYDCNSGIWEVKERGSEVQDHPQLYIGFKASLSSCTSVGQEPISGLITEESGRSGIMWEMGNVFKGREGHAEVWDQEFTLGNT